MITREEKLEALCESIGDNAPFLNNVLLWYSKLDLKSSHFELYEGNALFILHGEIENYGIVWNLEYATLQVQSSEVIDFLYDLIK